VASGLHKPSDRPAILLDTSTISLTLGEAEQFQNQRKSFWSLCQFEAAGAGDNTRNRCDNGIRNGCRECWPVNWQRPREHGAKVRLICASAGPEAKS
jgi:hypothetical protein